MPACTGISKYDHNIFYFSFFFTFENQYLFVLQIAELLLDASDPSNLERLLEARSISGMTALLIAVDQRDFPLIELLIGAGADTKAVDGNGDTAMILAARNPSEEASNPPKDLLSPPLHKVIIFLINS